MRGGVNPGTGLARLGKDEKTSPVKVVNGIPPHPYWGGVLHTPSIFVNGIPPHPYWGGVLQT